MSVLLWLGAIALDARTVQDMPASHSWEYAKHQTIQGLPVLQFIDRNARTYSLAVRLHKELGSPRALLAQLLASGDRGEVMILQTGAGEQLGSYVLRGLDEKRRVMSAKGELLIADLTLKLEEHRFEDFEVLEGIAVEGNATDATASPLAIDDSGSPDDVPLSAIVRSG